MGEVAYFHQKTVACSLTLGKFIRKASLTTYPFCEKTRAGIGSDFNIDWNRW